MDDQNTTIYHREWPPSGITVTISGPMASGKTLLRNAIIAALGGSDTRGIELFRKVSKDGAVTFIEEQT